MKNTANSFQLNFTFMLAKVAFSDYSTKYPPCFEAKNKGGGFMEATPLQSNMIC